MSEQNLNTIETRLAALERTNRRYRYLTVVLTTVIVGVGLIAARPDIPETIKTHKLEIVDDSGKTVVLGEASRDGGGRLTVFNQSSLAVMNVACNKDGHGELSVNDNHGINTVSARGTGDGGRFSVYTVGGNPVMEVTMEDNSGVLYTYGPDGSPTGKVPAGKVVKKKGK